MSFCINCGKPVAYKKVFTSEKYFVRDLEIKYKEAHAICMECGSEIYDSKINDENIIHRRSAYLKTLRGILT